MVCIYVCTCARVGARVCVCVFGRVRVNVNAVIRKNVQAQCMCVHANARSKERLGTLDDEWHTHMNTRFWHRLKKTYTGSKKVV